MSVVESMNHKLLKENVLEVNLAVQQGPAKGVGNVV